MEVVGLPAQCGVAQINNHDVVTFTAPARHDGGTAEFIDETLDTNLGFVSRRATTRSSSCTSARLDTHASSRWLLTTRPQFQPRLPDDKRRKSLFHRALISCSGTGFGAGYYQGCSRAVAPVDSFVFGHVDVSEIVFSAAGGHFLYVNGVQVYKGDGGLYDDSAVDGGGRGSIGRGTDTFDDDRFHGQIAEIIGFNVALTNPDRFALEGYLKRQWGLTF